MTGGIALLIHVRVVQLLTCESDLTISTLSSPDYEGEVAFISSCAVLDNGLVPSAQNSPTSLPTATSTRRSVSQRNSR